MPQKSKIHKGKTTEKYSVTINSLLWLNWHSKSEQFCSQKHILSHSQKSEYCEVKQFTEVIALYPFVTSELRKMKVNQDLILRQLLAQRRLETNSVRRQLIISFLFTYRILRKFLLGHQWFSTWMHMGNTWEFFKDPGHPQTQSFIMSEE